MKTIHLFATALLFSSLPVLAGASPATPAATAQQKPAAAKLSESRPGLFGAQQFTLKNGMRVVLIPNNRAPVVTQMVWYKAGAVDEVHGKTGLAHFLEHLMFKGSEHVPSGELSRRVRALGGNDNAFTTQDATAYHQSIAVSNMETVMAMEADRMKSLLLPPDEFEAERQVVLEERRQRTENDPRAHLIEQMRYSLFPGHPYGTPVIGWEQDIKNLTREDALAWHRHWYAPNNAILVVSGDIDLATLKTMAEKHYGPIQRRDVPHTQIPPVANFPAQTRMILRDPRVHQAQIIRLYRVPSATQDKNASLALEVMQEILSGGPATRLYKSLVFEQKIATNAALSYQGEMRDAGTLSVSLIPTGQAGLEDLEKAFDAEIALLAEKGVTPAELAEAKTRLKDGAAFARDSLTAPAQIIGAALMAGLGLDDVEYWADDLDAVTARQVQIAAQQYVRDNKAFVTGHIIVPQAANDAGTTKAGETP